MNPLWEQNLRALRARGEPACQELADSLATAGPDVTQPLRSRAGEPLPSVESSPGNRRSLESVYDAAAEARRWVEGLPTEATLVIFGGAPPALLEAVGVLNPSRVVMLEPRPAVWRSLFSVRDYRTVIGQPWWFPELDRAGEWVTRLGQRYHPLWDGPLTVRDWRAATDGPQEYWGHQKERLRDEVDRWTGDFSTQARFGARWYRNTLTNLRYAVPTAGWGESLAGTAGVVVTGAGPGLEEALASPANRRLLDERPQTGWKLFTTDTALPALTTRSIRPDLVLVLDGQLPSSQHFHSPLPPGVPLLTDLASLPLFPRLGLPWAPFLSAHPFNRIVERVYSGFPRLDGSAGNVSGLALRFAEALGAPQVVLWGADLSYPEAKGYARGTYVYPARHRRSTRLFPAETSLSAPCYGSSTLESTGSQPRRYSTDLLRRYQSTMNALAADFSPALRVEFPVPSQSWAIGRSRGAEPAWRPGTITGDWTVFRDHWRQRLEGLPVPAQHARFSEFLGTLEQSVAQDWLALWPLALALHRQDDSPAERLDRVLRAALAVMQD